MIRHYHVTAQGHYRLVTTDCPCWVRGWSLIPRPMPTETEAAWAAMALRVTERQP